jgi:tripartite ATP-independent transporter DctM subunit
MTLAAAARRGFETSEDALAIAVLAAMALLPLLEIAGRRLFNIGVPGSILVVQHLTLVIAFLGAARAAREDKLLALATVSFLPERWRRPARIAAHAAGAAVSAWLVAASIDLVRAERASGEVVGMGVPVWAVLCVMPLGLGLIGARLAWRADEGRLGRALAAAGLAVPLVLAAIAGREAEPLVWPWAVGLAVAMLLGLPLFAIIGGLALLLFWCDGTPVASVPVETYRLTSFPVLPAVPLFTLGGFILAAGGASRRLLRVFTALVGWLPGGAAIVTTFVFAFFTSFTGASGVTILSLGGLLLPVLIKSGYPERFSVGLLTVSGSIGLLFPPSLPVILYGVYAQQPIDTLFVAGFIPGILLVTAVAAWGVRQDFVTGAARPRFALAEAGEALWDAKWELLLPVVVLWGIFGGFATMVEAAALTVFYAVVVECFVYRDLSPARGLSQATLDCATLVGGFLIILGMALGLTNYLIDADVPTRVLAWVRLHIASRWAFLLALNVFLLAVGALMDIYSAIFVVVPLITPIAAAYGVDPIHLGIIFLANLELGYIVPPMGENLFLSSYRFGHPVMRVFRFTLPFILILGAAVLLITYLPVMTLGLGRLLGR